MIFEELRAPSEDFLRRVVEDLLDRVVVEDHRVTRREEQLDQLGNVLLLKLESDREAKAHPAKPPFFRSLGEASRTAAALRKRYAELVARYPDTFTSERDLSLRLADGTIDACVGALAGLRLIDLAAATVAVAFQVLRSEALKAREGQYFTPQAVIEAGIRLLRLTRDDFVLDPACGTGGFLIEALLEVERANPGRPSELSRWARTHVFGIERDAIGLKLTKAMMQIAGGGGAHCVRGDSVRVHRWREEFPHLGEPHFQDGRFTVVVTNPPFGENLKVSAEDLRLSGLTIATKGGTKHADLEIGLVFLERAYQWLRPGGRLGIVLPETYFFSVHYAFLLDWLRPRLKPVVVANVPMEAFQGFCRAKTNFYVFEKIE